MKFISTPSHGYLKVELSTFKKYSDSKAMKNYSDLEYSYIASKSVLLEEDVDAGEFILWYESFYNKKISISNTYQKSVRKTYRLSDNYRVVNGRQPVYLKEIT